MKLFLGYASKPELSRETLYQGGCEIASTGEVEVQSWEDLRIAGRVIVRQILAAIDEAAVSAFDVSTLNENVLFELGYAVARGKRIWLLLDKTDADARKRWKQFQLLSGVGYAGWANVEDIKVAFLRDRPDRTDATLYNDLIEPELEAAIAGSILYVPTYHTTEPSRQVSRRLEQERHRGIRLLVGDPTESANSMQWYAAKAYQTECTIVHFEAPRRELATLHNPRSAFVAGLARGFDRALLMLSEEDYSPPLDYEDLLKVYTSTREAALLVDGWLRELNLQPRSKARAQRVKLATELRTLRFGEHVAENEVATLSDYFVETAAFDDVISTRDALFIGRKGSGKTANMFEAAARLSEDVRNLVVIIKPASYEFTSLLTLLSSLPISLQQYSIEALWKFLLHSEIANRVVEMVENRAAGIPYTEDEKRLLDFVDSTEFGPRNDFATRFERNITALTNLGLSSKTTESEGRDLLNEALHTQAIARLRSLLGPVLKSRQRVAVLVDNLDKGWDRSADLPLLAQLLLGLLAAVGRVRVDFSKEDYWRERISLTIATFLRSDIFSFIQSVAREPDKLPVSVVEWKDHEVLLRVIEERFLAARPPDTDPSELWNKFFCDNVMGIPTRLYLAKNSLPRPRDLIYFCNSAAVAAVNRGHQRIEEEDVLSGQRTYSQFAFEALLVENGITISQLNDVLLEFLGETSVLEGSRVQELVARAGVADAMIDTIIDRLLAMSFLGVEIAPDRFDFPEHRTNLRRAAVLARKLTETGATPSRLAIHPAFRPYLEVEEDRLG
jgi:hypothetical protein